VLVFPAMPEDLLLLLMNRIKKWLFRKLHLCLSIETQTSFQFQLTKCFSHAACFACCSLDDSS